MGSTSSEHPNRLLKPFLERAESAARDRGLMMNMLKLASEKLRHTQGKVRAIRSDVETLIRFVKAWVKGEYRKMPWKSLMMSIAAIAYFLSPFDAVPDFLAMIGFFDDIAIVMYVLKSIRKDLDEFRRWEHATISQDNHS